MRVQHAGTTGQARVWLAGIIGLTVVVTPLIAVTAASAAEITTLTAAHSGKLAQVPAGSTDGAALTQNAATGTTNQQWEARDAGGGYVQLVNAATGKCADVTARSLVDGAAVVQWTCNTGTNQQWQLRDAGNGQATSRSGGGSPPCRTTSPPGWTGTSSPTTATPTTTRSPG